MNSKTKKALPAWLPLVIGTLLVVQFAGLGVWQISRGMEKRADRVAFNAETGFAAWRHGMEVRPFQRLKATGYYDNDRQFLLENIIVNGRYGYYALTPLIGEKDEPVLLVNRGWIEKSSDAVDAGVLDVPTTRTVVHGRAGSLPRAGYKMGDAIVPGSDWPKHAVYPDSAEISNALGVEVQPFVLLMDHEEEHGFLRQWVPTEFGPGKHFAYAFQWFAMAVVLAALLTWNYRKRRFQS